MLEKAPQQLSWDPVGPKARLGWCLADGLMDSVRGHRAAATDARYEAPFNSCSQCA
jgi:hypothetical protein